MTDTIVIMNPLWLRNAALVGMSDNQCRRSVEHADTPRLRAGSMLYHWATLSRPPFSFDAKIRMETWRSRSGGLWNSAVKVNF